MTKHNPTKEKLLKSAKELFWTRGYSNVSVRDISRAAGVDAALVSRYFGGKEALFDATLEQITHWEPLMAEDDRFLTEAVAFFSKPFDPKQDEATTFSMLLSNIIDPEMGDRIRDLVRHALADPLADKLGGAQAHERAALLLSVLFGAALMRKYFQLDGFELMGPDDLGAQLMRLGQVALATLDLDAQD